MTLLFIIYLLIVICVREVILKENEIFLKLVKKGGGGVNPIQTFSGQPSYFLREKDQTRINNLHHEKAEFVVCFFLPKGGGVIIFKKWCKDFSKVVSVKCTLYLVRPPTCVWVSVLSRSGSMAAQLSTCKKSFEYNLFLGTKRIFLAACIGGKVSGGATDPPGPIWLKYGQTELAKYYLY